MLHSPFCKDLCFPLGTVKPCFVSERVTRADPRTVRFEKFLNFWATIVIQILYIPSKKWVNSLHFSIPLANTSALTLCRKGQQTASHNPAFHNSTQFHVDDLCSLLSVY